ncbi:hypothetical protein CCHL11_02780, partial [Colletotrichum chlorophyti]
MSNLDLIKYMLGVRTTYTRLDWYNAMQLDPRNNNVLSTKDDTIHTKLRCCSDMTWFYVTL